MMRLALFQIHRQLRQQEARRSAQSQEFSNMNDLTFDIPAKFSPSPENTTALLLGLPSSEDFEDVSPQVQADLIEFQRRAEWGYRILEKISVASHLPALKGTRIQLLRMEPELKGKAEKYRQQIRAITGGNQFLRLLHADWASGKRINEQLSDAELKAIDMSSKIRLTLKQRADHFDELVECITRARCEYAAIRSVHGGNSYVKRGREGEILIRPVTELPEHVQSQYEELRLKSGLLPRITEEAAHAIQKLLEAEHLNSR
jgi:hypothetical protein